jgi:hypothetical protein
MFLKDPGSTLDYRVDWTAACPEGHAIVTSSWHIEPDMAGGLQVEAHALEGKQATVRVSGGAVGTLSRIVNRVGFSNGSVEERTLALRVEER